MTQVPWQGATAFFKVVCRLGSNAPDSEDADLYPDLVSETGKVEISCSVAKFRYTELSGRTRMVVMPKQTFQIQASTGELIDDNGQIGVYLLDSTSGLIDPSGFTYTANITPTKGASWSVVFTGGQAVEGVLDLVSASSVAPAGGTPGLDGRVTSLEAQVAELGRVYKGPSAPSDTTLIWLQTS